MSKDKGNPNIAEIGKATRFGGGRNCPHDAQRRASPPWSVKAALRRIVCTTFDNTENITLQRLMKIFGKNPSGAELVACKLFIAAIKNYQAMSIFVNLLEGPPLPHNE